MAPKPRRHSRDLSKKSDSMKVDPKIWDMIKGKKNVVGYSATLKNKIKNGKIIPNTKVIRIYVSKKEPTITLDAEHVIPPVINGIETDVIEIGNVKAQNKVYD